MINFKVPPDQLAVSVMSHNHIQDGDDFRVDGWVYNKGERTRKWLSRLNDNGERHLIWHPKLDDLPALELKRWKAVVYWDKFHKEVWHPAFQALWEVKQAHAQVLHPYKGEKIQPWWLYTASDDGMGPAFGYNWVDMPQEPLNLEVGNRLYQVEQRTKEIRRRKRILIVAFDRALDMFLFKQEKPKYPGQTGRLVINGRIYWVVTKINQGISKL